MKTQTLNHPNAATYWILVGACGAMLLGTCVFSLLFFMSADDESLSALSNGQRMTINPKTKESTGVMRVSNASGDQTNPDQKTSSDAAKKELAFDVGTDTDIKATSAPSDALAAPENNALSKAAMVAAESEAIRAAPVYPKTAASLAAAPDSRLMEKTKWGAVPIQASGTSPFEVYKRPFVATTSPKAKIAIVVLDVGMTKNLAEQVLTLPADITIAYNPYAPNVALWMENGRNMGHEAWLMLPTQAQDFPASDPGALAQLLSAKPQVNAANLLQTLARASGYVGLITAPDSAVVNRVSHLSVLLDSLAARGLALMATRASDDSAALKAQRAGKLSILADLVLDETLTAQAVAKQLATLEMLATKNGKALGVIHATPLAMTMLTQWHKQLGAKPVILAPASALVAH